MQTRHKVIHIFHPANYYSGPSSKLDFFNQLPYMNTNFYFHQVGRPLLDWNLGLEFKRAYNFQIFEGLELPPLPHIPRQYNLGDFFAELIRYAEAKEKELLEREPDQTPVILLKELKLFREELGLWTLNRVMIDKVEMNGGTPEKKSSTDTSPGTDENKASASISGVASDLDEPPSKPKAAKTE